MLYPILYGIILQKDSKQQLIELRKVIDLGILQEAMKQMGDQEFEELGIEIRNMEEEIKKKEPSSVKIFEADVRFHSVLVDVMKNDLLDSIAYYVDKITRQTRVLTIDYMLERGHREEFVTLHRDMLDMLRNKREDQIPEIVERHYQYWEK